MNELRVCRRLLGRFKAHELVVLRSGSFWAFGTRGPLYLHQNFDLHAVWTDENTQGQSLACLVIAGSTLQ